MHYKKIVKGGEVFGTKLKGAVYLFFVFLLTLSLMCFLLLSATGFYAFDMRFYEKELDKYGRAEHIGTAREALLESTRKMLDYYRGRAEDPQSIILVNGKAVPLFGERELLHMRDVRGLFRVGFMLRNLSGVAVLLISGALLFFRGSRGLATALIQSSVLGLLCLGGLLLYVFLSFEESFTYFHLLLFENELWRLNPDTENLIRLFPLEFFADIAKRITLTFVAMCAGIITLAGLWLRRLSRPVRGITFRIPPESIYGPRK